MPGQPARASAELVFPRVVFRVSVSPCDSSERPFPVCYFRVWYSACPFPRVLPCVSPAVASGGALRLCSVT